MRNQPFAPPHLALGFETNGTDHSGKTNNLKHHLPPRKAAGKKEKQNGKTKRHYRTGRYYWRYYLLQIKRWLPRTGTCPRISRIVANNPAFQSTCENNAEFGRAGKASAIIRKAFRTVIATAKTGRLPALLTTEFVRVIKAKGAYHHVFEEVASVYIRLRDSFADYPLMLSVGLDAILENHRQIY